MSIVPESGWFSFVIILKRVVLPIPFGPMTPTIALGGNSNEHLSMRRLSSKPFDMSWNESLVLLQRDPALEKKENEVVSRYFHGYCKTRMKLTDIG